MELRRRYAAARRRRRNAPAWEGQARRTREGAWELFDSLANGSRTRIVIVKENQQAEGNK